MVVIIKKLKGYSNIFYQQKMNEEKRLAVIVPFAFRRLSTLENLLDHLLEDGWQLQELNLGFVFVFKRCEPKNDKYVILMDNKKRPIPPYESSILEKFIPSFNSNDICFSCYTNYYYNFYRVENLDEKVREMVRKKRQKRVVRLLVIEILLFIFLITAFVYVLFMS